MTLEALKKRIKTTTDLRNIVSTMKSLSSVSIVAYEKAQISLTDYIQNIWNGFLILDKNKALRIPKVEPSDQALAIIIGSDNGLVGRFNKEIISFAQKELQDFKTSYITVGRRIASLMLNEKNIIAKYPISNSIKETANISLAILKNIPQIKENKKLPSVFVFYHEHISGQPVSCQKTQLLPFSQSILNPIKSMKWDGRSWPCFKIDSNILLLSLIQEYIGITLDSALIKSLAAEHYIRMINMQNAEKNIDERLYEMNLKYQQKRQENITDELIDIVSASQAMRKK